MRPGALAGRRARMRRKLSIGVTASLTPALAGWVGALCRPSAKFACCFIPRGVSSHSDRALLTSDRSGLSGHSGRYALNTVFGSTTQIPVGLRNLRAWWVGGRPSCDARRHPDRARVWPPRPTGVSAPRRWIVGRSKGPTPPFRPSSGEDLSRLTGPRPLESPEQRGSSGGAGGVISVQKRRVRAIHTPALGTFFTVSEL